MAGFGQTGRAFGIGQLAGMPRIMTPLRRLLDFVAADTGSALVAGIGRRDRFLATPHGGAHPAANGASVGLALSAAAWADRPLSQVVAAGAELFQTGTLIDKSTAPASVSESPAGQINIIANGSAAARADIPVATQAGQVYRVSFTASGALSCRVGSSAGGTDNMADATLSGTQTYYFRASASTSYLRWWTNFNGTRTVTAISVKPVPGFPAVQATEASRPTWQGGNFGHLEFDGSNDQLEFAALVPGAAGTMAAAFRAGENGAASQTILAAGTTGMDRRCRLVINASGHPSFVLGPNTSFEGPIIDYRGQDIVMVQTWGAGRRRCHLWTADAPWWSDKAHTNTFDGGGSAYRLGTLEAGSGDWFKGRLYGALVRNVETSDVDIRNIIIPALMGLHP